MHPPVFLIGYMASGKTTLGRAIQALSDYDFVDLDDFIEADSSMSISQIFATFGEADFRRRESEALRRLVATPSRRPLIIACGGGTPCHAGNLDFMLHAGITVWLDVPVPRIVQRLSIERSRRPLVANLSDEQLSDFVTSALQSRLPFYSRALHRFDSSRLESSDQVNQSAREFIARFLPQ